VTEQEEGEVILASGFGCSPHLSFRFQVQAHLDSHAVCWYFSYSQDTYCTMRAKPLGSHPLEEDSVTVGLHIDKLLAVPGQIWSGVQVSTK
jgi:hypothetical protein